MNMKNMLCITPITETPAHAKLSNIYMCEIVTKGLQFITFLMVWSIMDEWVSHGSLCHVWLKWVSA